MEANVKAPFCINPFERFRVACDGEVYFCCYQRETSLGNLKNSTPEEIWASDLANQIRRETLDGHLHELCLVEGCPEMFRPLHGAPAQAFRMPQRLEIDLPEDHCNIGGKNPGENSPACIMCPRDDPKYRLKRSDAIFDLLPRLRTLVPHLKILHVQGIAESFWHDAIFRILDGLEFDRFRDQIRVGTFTNGVALNRDRIKRFLERCPRSIVHFSIDAGTPETYVKIRRLDAYGTVLNNLMEYSRLRKDYPGAELRIHNNINTLNVDEVVAMVRVAAEAEVDHLMFTPTLGHCHSIRANAENAYRFREAEQAILAEGRRLGMPVTIAKPLDAGLAGEGFSPIDPHAIRAMGHVETVESGALIGWARDPKHPEEPLEIAVFHEGKRIAGGMADRYRADLAKPGGGGLHGFSIPLPVKELPREGGHLTVRAVNPPIELSGSPFAFREIRRKPEGRLEFLRGNSAIGWAWDPESPEKKVEVEILLEGPGESRTRVVVADQYRSDLAQAGIGDGRHAFKIELPQELLAEARFVSARVLDPLEELSNSPLPR